MKQRPILFSTPMVQAILEGRKTQTRRVVKPQPIYDLSKGVTPFNHGILWGSRSNKNPDGSYSLWKAKCPYGKVGDVLWVRETFINGNNASLDSNIGKDEKDWTLRYWLYKDGSQLYSDGSYFPENKTGKERGFKGIKWKPSIHMPKAAARIWLEVVSVKVESLQDITEADAVAEGVEPTTTMYEGSVQLYKQYNREPMSYSEARGSFQSLWQSINGPESWEANPVVWVIEVKQINKP